eukprot:SAG31_NODE_41_length_31342_cov_8.029286_6_plen_99_part_00
MGFGSEEGHWQRMRREQQAAPAAQRQQRWCVAANAERGSRHSARHVAQGGAMLGEESSDSTDGEPRVGVRWLCSLFPDRATWGLAPKDFALNMWMTRC